MTTMILNKLIPLNICNLELIYILINIRETMRFNKDGTPTDEIIGYTITVIDVCEFNQIKIKVPKVDLEITSEELEKVKGEGNRIFVEIEEGYVKPYFNNRTRTIEDSILANNFHIVESHL